jgi:hypothetical protein
MAYLVNMAPRLAELHRVLKLTGSLYLHCDPTMSHYLKILLDAVFDPRNFQNEISWKRFSAKNDSLRFGRSHDVVLFYTKGKTFTWNAQFGPFELDYVDENYRYVEAETGRRYRRGDLTAAKPGGDVSYEWHGARPYKGRYWAYSRENMDELLAAGRIEFRSTGMPVFKRYLDGTAGRPAPRHLDRRPASLWQQRATRLPDPKAARSPRTHHHRVVQPRRRRARPVLRVWNDSRCSRKARAAVGRHRCHVPGDRLDREAPDWHIR